MSLHKKRKSTIDADTSKCILDPTFVVKMHEQSNLPHENFPTKAVFTRDVIDMSSHDQNKVNRRSKFEPEGVLQDNCSISIDELANKIHKVTEANMKEELSKDDQRLKDDYNIEPYDGRAIKTLFDFKLNDIEQHRYNELRRQHCCDLMICFGASTGIGTPVFVWIPCKRISLDISDYSSW